MTERKFTPPTSFPAEYVTTKGEKMTLLAEGIGEYKYIGQCEDDLWWTFTADGSNWADGVPSTIDLHDIPKTTVQWANDYEEIFGCTWHDSREEADANAMWDCIAVIRREWTEGQPPEYFTEEARMSNDLVKRLRHPVGGMRPTISDGRAAADRIEELEAKLDWVLVERDETFALMLDRAQTVEAKLAKAVEALEQIASHRKKCHEYDDDVGHERREFDVEDMIIMEYAARTTLAELKGGKDE